MDAITNLTYLGWRIELGSDVSCPMVVGGKRSIFEASISPSSTTIKKRKEKKPERSDALNL